MGTRWELRVGKLFSVITITYNNRNGLKKTASSIAHQTCPDYEWIIIDGGSTDGTHDDLATYPVTKSISEPDSGIYDAMNKGINLATGDYLIFMNAGDQFASDTVLDAVKNKILNSHEDLVYGDSWEEGENSKSLHFKAAKPHTTIARGLFTHHQALFYKRTSLRNLRYDTKYKIAADYALTLNFLKSGNRSCRYIPIPICIFEQGGISQKNISLGRAEQFKARQEGGMPFPRNLYITAEQWAASKLRSLSPSLYWELKRLTRGRTQPNE